MFNTKREMFLSKNFWHRIAYTLLFCMPSVINALAPLSFRSQSVNAAREIVGWQQYINLPVNRSYGAFTITPEYTQTFRSGDLARCIFGSDVSCTTCASSIKVSGSRVENRGTTDWLADYFGLPTDFESTLNFRPRIQNFLVDFNVFVGNACGLYFRVHAPLVYTRWSLQFTEDNIVAGTSPYEPGYFNAAPPPGVERSDLLANATQFFNGSVPTLGSGVTFQSLQCSKLTSACSCDDPRTLTRLSDVEMAFGWNFWCDPLYLAGISIRVSAPTGNKTCDEFLFTPVIGSGGFWKLGVGLNAQVLFWQDCAAQNQWGIYFDARLQHLFNTCQTRCFDLCGKPNSRYMLAQKLGTERQEVHLIGDSNAGVEFQNEFAPVANLTASTVNVSVKAEADVVIKVAYYACDWSFDLGYNFWGRSCENLCLKNHNSALDGKTWALKGDAFVVGFADTGSNSEIPVRLAAVQADATINSGTNNFIGPDGDQGGIGGVRPTANPGITNPQVLVGVNGATGDLDVVDRLPTEEGVPTRSSNAVVFLSECDLNLAGSKGSSNKIFAHASYTWNHACKTFLGFGGEIEFNRHNDCSILPCTNACTPSDCTLFCPGKKRFSCFDCALNQWGIWLKGGVAF